MLSFQFLDKIDNFCTQIHHRFGGVITTAPKKNGQFLQACTDIRKDVAFASNCVFHVEGTQRFNFEVEICTTIFPMLWAFWGPETYLKHCVSKSGTRKKICWISWLNHMICCCKIWEVPNLLQDSRIWWKFGGSSRDGRSFRPMRFGLWDPILTWPWKWLTNGGDPNHWISSKKKVLFLEVTGARVGFLLKGLVVWLVCFLKSSMGCWKKSGQMAGIWTTNHQATSKKGWQSWYPPEVEQSSWQVPFPIGKDRLPTIHSSGASGQTSMMVSPNDVI